MWMFILLPFVKLETCVVNSSNYMAGKIVDGSGLPQRYSNWINLCNLHIGCVSVSVFLRSVGCFPGNPQLLAACWTQVPIRKGTAGPGLDSLWRGLAWELSCHCNTALLHGSKLQSLSELSLPQTCIKCLCQVPSTKWAPEMDFCWSKLLVSAAITIVTGPEQTSLSCGNGRFLW